MRLRFKILSGFLILALMPTIAPTAAWDVDTGSAMVVMIVTVMSAAIEEITAN